MILFTRDRPHRIYPNAHAAGRAGTPLCGKHIIAGWTATEADALPDCPECLRRLAAPPVIDRWCERCGVSYAAHPRCRCGLLVGPQHVAKAAPCRWCRKEGR